MSHSLRTGNSFFKNEHVEAFNCFARTDSNDPEKKQFVVLFFFFLQENRVFPAFSKFFPPFHGHFQIVQNQIGVPKFCHEQNLPGIPHVWLDNVTGKLCNKIQNEFNTAN